MSPFAAAAWTHPRFAPYAHLVARLAARPGFPTVAELDAVLADHLRRPGGRAVRLVEQRPAPRRRQVLDAAALYEPHIADRGEVPTRPGNLHDLCNALVWAVFPRAKWSLTVRVAALQRARAAGAARLPGTRSAEHDRLALLDEGGLLALAGGDVVFGHAVLEHVVRGRLDVRAARCPLAVEPGASLDAVDAALAAALDAGATAAPGPGVAIDDARLLVS